MDNKKFLEKASHIIQDVEPELSESIKGMVMESYGFISCEGKWVKISERNKIIHHRYV